MEDKGMMVRLTGLWKREGKNGDYYSGNLGTARLLLFRNKTKRSETDCDLVLYISPAPKGERDAGE